MRVKPAGAQTNTRPGFARFNLSRMPLQLSTGAKFGKNLQQLGTAFATGCFLADMREASTKAIFISATALAIGAWLWFLGWMTMLLIQAIGS